MPVFNGSSSASTDGLTTVTLSHEIATGPEDDPCLLVVFGTRATTPGDDIVTGCTYAGLPMQKVVETGTSSGGDRVMVFALSNPPLPGANDIVATLTGTGQVGVMVALNFYNNHQDFPTGPASVLHGSNQPIGNQNLTYGCAEGDFVLNIMAWTFAGTASVGSAPVGQTFIGSFGSGSGQNCSIAYDSQVFPSPTNNAETWSTAVNFTASNTWTRVLFAIKDVSNPPGAGDLPPAYRNELMVGGQA